MRTNGKEASKSALVVLCEGNSPVTGEFPAQRASNAERASIWWRHRELLNLVELQPICPTQKLVIIVRGSFHVTFIVTPLAHFFLIVGVMICWQNAIFSVLYFIVCLFQIQYIFLQGKAHSNYILPLGYTDLASGKPTSSSSVLGDLNPKLAVDSNPSPDSSKMSCFFSGFEDHPWWSVDLGRTVQVKTIIVTTRDKAGEYISSLAITLNSIIALPLYIWCVWPMHLDGEAWRST